MLTIRAHSDKIFIKKDFMLLGSGDIHTSWLSLDAIQSSYETIEIIFGRETVALLRLSTHKLW